MTIDLLNLTVESWHDLGVHLMVTHGASIKLNEQTNNDRFDIVNVHRCF